MKRTWAILAITSACGLVGCASDGSWSTASSDNNNDTNAGMHDTQPVAQGNTDIPISPANDKTNFSGITAEDRDFVRNASAANMYEVQAGDKALAKSSDANIKAIAQRMVDDHMKSNHELDALAQKKRIDLAALPYGEQTKLLARLDGLSGAEFDAEYLRQQKSAHTDAISMFQTAASNASDRDIREWAAQTLPILRSHLDMLNNENMNNIGSER